MSTEAELAQSMPPAGPILLGKTNTPEFGMAPTTAWIPPGGPPAEVLR